MIKLSKFFLLLFCLLLSPPLLALELLRLENALSHFRAGYNFPLRLVIRSPQTFEGQLKLTVGKYSYTQRISLQGGETKVFWLYPLLYPPLSPLSLICEGRTEKKDWSESLAKVLSEVQQAEGWDFVSQKLALIPPKGEALQAADALELQTSPSPQQLTSLLSWVALGGKLIWPPHLSSPPHPFSQREKTSYGLGFVLRRPLQDSESYRQPWVFGRPSPLEDAKWYQLTSHLAPSQVAAGKYAFVFLGYCALVLCFLLSSKPRLWGLLLCASGLFLFWLSFSEPRVTRLWCVVKILPSQNLAVGEAFVNVHSLGQTKTFSLQSSLLFRPVFYSHPAQRPWGKFAPNNLQWPSSRLSVFATTLVLPLSSPLHIEKKGNSLHWRFPFTFQRLWLWEGDKVFSLSPSDLKGQGTLASAKQPATLKVWAEYIRHRYLSAPKASFLLLEGPSLALPLHFSSEKHLSAPSLWILEL